MEKQVKSQWVVTVHCRGTSAQFYMAKRNGEVHTSKDLNYINKLVRERSY